MIRPFTLITMLCAAGAGAYLFAVKHRAQILDDQFAAVAQQSRLDDARIRVLQAQWALEIDPTRLNGLAERFTALHPMQPAQLVTLASLRATLPPAGAAAPGYNPQAIMPAGPQIPPASPDQVAAANPAATPSPLFLPLPPPAAPRPNVAQPRVATPAHMASAPRIKNAVSHLGMSQYAEALPSPRPLYAAAPYLPAPARLVPVQVSDRLANGSGSALGMAVDLAPPQPLTGHGN